MNYLSKEKLLLIINKFILLYFEQNFIYSSFYFTFDKNKYVEFIINLFIFIKIFIDSLIEFFYLTKFEITFLKQNFLLKNINKLYLK